MSTYRYSYCPHCKKALSLHQRSEFFFYDRYFGLKYERCPNCKQIYSTNKKLYYQMNQHERDILKLFYPINILSISASLFAILLVLVFFISSLILGDNLSDYINQIWLILALLSIPCIIAGIFAGKKDYENMKKTNVDDFEIDDELKLINK